MIDDIGIENLTDEQIVRIVLARDGLTLSPLPFEPERSTVMGFYRLAKHVPFSRLDGLLELFAAYANELLPEHAGYQENDLIDLQYALILKRLNSTEPVDPLNLWRWLEPFAERGSYNRDQGNLLADWLNTHLSVRRAIQRHVLLVKASEKDVWQRAWRLHRDAINLYPTQADIVDLLKTMDSADLRWREILELGKTWGDEGRPLREAARRFAAGRPEDLAWIDAKVDRPVPEWERKQAKRDRKHKEERAQKHATHRGEFLTRIGDVTAGEYGVIVSLAQAYLNRFRDIGDGVPAHERVADWVGEEIAAAAREGFEAFLHARVARPPPAASQLCWIIARYLEGRAWPKYRALAPVEDPGHRLAPVNASVTRRVPYDA